MRLIVVVCALVAGCTHTQADVDARTSHSSLFVQVEGGRSLATLLGLSILAAGIYEAEWGSPTRKAPELDPNRRVSEQDCSKPIDYSLGNIRCK